MATKFTFGVMAFAIILAGCSADEKADSSSFQTIQIRQDQLQTFLSFETDTIARPYDIAFLPNGNRAVLDSGLKTVLIYNEQGELQTHFGREGKGPGEFTQPINLQQVEDYIYVSDGRQYRRHKFKLDGQFVATEQADLSPFLFANAIMIGNGEFLLPANGKNESLLLYNNINTDSTLYFGKAMGDSVSVLNLATNK